MRNQLAAAYEIVSVARRHNIPIDDMAEPAEAVALILAELRERSRLWKSDIKSLEALAFEFGASDNGVSHATGASFAAGTKVGE